MDADSTVPDTERHWLIAALPRGARPFGLLARFDRPIGWWLLFWPCAWSVALTGGAAERWDLLLWFLLGAIAMRGAGCVYNDIVDRDLDRKVERTRARPLASGRVSLRAAWAWLLALCLVGFAVLLQLRWEAQLVALWSIALVAAYPFMKRITWWPQAWLGLVFSWGALVGWTAITGAAAPALAWLYAGSVFWVIGYDTIYALQDIEDDALAGVKSTARRFGRYARAGISLFYVLALACWSMALWDIRPQWLGLATLIPVALHLFWQVATLRIDNGEDALAKFRSNREAGLLMALACFVVGATA
ncbi:MAG: 4-hydroxybenzoate octaprenyltransferase [Pseudomonadota bacterium]